MTQAKLTAVIDFSVRVPAFVAEKARPVNQSLFPVSEAIRLWFSDRSAAERVKAPFRKLVIILIDEATWSRGMQATNGLGVCEVTVPVSDAELRERMTDHRWVLGLVKRALSCLGEGPSWRSPEDLYWRSPALDAFVDELLGQPLPLMHLFDRMKRVDRKTGTVCVPWVSVRPLETKVGVRFESEQGRRDVTVHSEPRPFMVNTMLSDWGPLVKSAIRGGEYVLMDRNGNVLATVPIAS